MTFQGNDALSTSGLPACDHCATIHALRKYGTPYLSCRPTDARRKAGVRPTWAEADKHFRRRGCQEAGVSSGQLGRVAHPLRFCFGQRVGLPFASAFLLAREAEDPGPIFVATLLRNFSFFPGVLPQGVRSRPVSAFREARLQRGLGVKSVCWTANLNVRHKAGSCPAVPHRASEGLK